MEVLFKVGQVVRIKYTPGVKFFIVEVNVQTCYADVQQVWYSGRAFTSRGIERTLTKVSQIELELVPEMSEDLKKMIADYKKVKKDKTDLVEKQGFEKAAELRGKEVALRDSIKDKVEEEGIDLKIWEL